MNETTPQWGSSTKRTVVLMLVVLLALVLYRFRAVIPPLVIAVLIAFILDPIVRFSTRRLNLSRSWATALVFAVLVLSLLGTVAAPVTVVPSIQRAVESLQIDFAQVSADVGALFERPVVVGGYALDLSVAYTEVSSMVRSFLLSVAQGTVDIALSIASGAVWLVFILMAAFYVLKDADRIGAQIDRLAPPGHRADLNRLRRQINGVWHAFLRGQLLLGLAMTIITTVVCTAVGLPYAFAMGLLAGAMELVPSIGPFVAAIPAILLALFQGSAFLSLSNFWFAVLVLILYLIIQQVEGNLLVPRILGRTLNLHPLIVLIGIILGGSLVGILGMLLAAPVLATVRIIAHYVFCRLYDKDPFVELEKDVLPASPSRLRRAQEALTRWLVERRLSDRTDNHTEPPEVTG